MKRHKNGTGINVYIQTIPHNKHRYPTCGDWWWKDNTLEIRVSKMGDWRMEMAVAIHELTEALACLQRGILQDTVDRYDLGPGLKSDEPGDDKRCPYRREHRAAYVTEFALLDTLDVNIREYKKATAGLYGGT